MPDFQYFVASSLDGFIATRDDNLDWLLQFDGFAGGQESYDAFMADVGCIVMGGDTYAWLRKHEPDNWPYPATPCWVFTHHEHSVPKGADVTFVRGPVAEFVEDLRACRGRPERLDRRRRGPGGPVRGRLRAGRDHHLHHSRGAGQRQSGTADCGADGAA